jgi:hypothetical protein
LVHAAYDVGHHYFATNTSTPDGYALFCIVVDIIIAMYLFLLSRKLPNANITFA